MDTAGPGAPGLPLVSIKNISSSITPAKLITDGINEKGHNASVSLIRLPD
jgi:hypothetical protein